MVLKSKETTIAYRCPVCGKSILGMVGIFTLSGDMIKVKCDCGGSELTIVRTSDNKVRLSVPCIICPNPHNYVISSDTFFSRDIFSLSCTYSNIDICFIGSKEKVLEAIALSDEQLMQILADAGMSDYALFRSGIELMHKNGELEDQLDFTHVEEIVRFMLADLGEEGCIHCDCGAGSGEYDFEFVDDSVRVFCRKCGAEVMLPMSSTLAASEFLQTDELFLKKS